MTPELTEVIEKVRTATLAANFTVTELVACIDALQELKINLSLEFQAVRDQRAAEHREWREFMAEMRELITEIRGNKRITESVLHLIESPQAGEFGDGTEAEGRRGTQRTDAKTRGPVSHGWGAVRAGV